MSHHTGYGLTAHLFLQVEREKLKTAEDTFRLSADRGRLDRSLTTVEQELAEAQRQVQALEVGVSPS